MEEGTVEDIFYRPQHPYTQGLLRSIPKSAGEKKERLVPIQGTPPNLLRPPTGCPFAERCPHKTAKCESERPLYVQVNETQRMLCWLDGERHPET
jgi:oligopeptide/dipeptide ABC transporter ATP-binding protein